MEERIFQLIVNENEITWQSILYDLVRTEGMDPWNISVSMITNKYLGMLKTLKEMDFNVSGKVILAAAILLKIKSKRLVGEDMDGFDQLLSSANDVTEEEFYSELEQEMKQMQERGEKFELIPKTPQPRKRKVSIYDLVGALEKALEVKKRRLIKSIPEIQVQIPEKSDDITLLIKELYNNILDFHALKKDERLTFSQLIPSDLKGDKVATLIPLLHLSNERKINLHQAVHFGEIDIRLVKIKTEDNS